MDVSDNWHQVEIGKKLVLQLDNTAVAGVGWGTGAGETSQPVCVQNRKWTESGLGQGRLVVGRGGWWARNWFCNLTTQKD